MRRLFSSYTKSNEKSVYDGMSLIPSRVVSTDILGANLKYDGRVWIPFWCEFGSCEAGGR